MRNFLRLNLILSAVFTSCIYSFSGGFPSKYRNVYIAPLNNETNRQDITLDVQNYFIDAMREDGRLNIVAEKQAKMKIIPTLLSFNKNASEFTESGEITVYTITIKAQILTHPVDDTLSFLKDSIFYGKGVYSASSEDEDTGIKRATEDLVNNFINKLFEIKDL